MSNASTPTFITCAYGLEYAGFIWPHLYSIARLYPQSQHIFLFQDIQNHEIEIAKELFPNVRFIETDHAISARNSAVAIASKLKLWTEACAYATTGKICFIDIDTIVSNRFDELLKISADAIFTFKETGYPINTGVFFVESGRAGSKIIKKWLEITLEVIENDLQNAIRVSGAADQHALRKMIGFHDYDENLKKVTIDTEEFIFAGVDCKRYNQTECAKIEPTTSIIHYKSGWHPILFRGGRFTKNRPKIACEEMLHYFKRTYATCTNERFAKAIIDASSQAKEAFCQSSKNEPYEERGILNSEMLCFLSLCKKLKVEVIIESGRCRGQSTAIMADFFADSSVTLESVEWIKNSDSEFAERRLANKNVKLFYGDSFAVIPKRVAVHRGKTIALLIDGPKGKDAIELIKSVILPKNKIVACFIHDSGIGSEARRLIQENFKRTFFTDHTDFVSTFSDLDLDCQLKPNVPLTIHSWRPNHKGEDRIESYGPTLGVILPFAFEGSKKARSSLIVGRERALNLLRKLNIHHFVRKIKSRHSIRS